ncbi:protein kinase [Herbiconiux sp. KACC 21604]|uniref:serine/threonine-protein kinase n=1 Tax=unclassified Herbiconiux TaxID=2618217 RepID=UPI0014924DA2|nr:serine/threonine-protein kinase [Herbiconiux sp. SALV-R1]QJU55577.1 protein kinase [Herbiconiux sp. SALV-R1]WPO86769.1 protein kinase [Herbiconiux sp. KACC 21604]
MNARRPPSAPPEIPGFSYVQLLGSGGFADVFLYEQRMPRRRVAIKVLLREALTDGARESFDAEANLMAQLSTHPSIVTIYQADISEDGRPYLAMEYCPKPNLGARYRREKISVAEALRIGVQVAGAVETSHRAGILHRDIKPANILVTEYNRPALTDFGISVALVGGDEQESVGMSIPWSPPEVFAATPSSGAAADIYSLGATVYTILAGRSPFEVPGGANSGLDLIGRIQTARLAPTGRADVPPSLEQVLATAMAKNESDRYSTALEFARALQKVQLELSMSVTPTDVLDEHVPTDEIDEEDDGNTRIRGIVTIDPTGPAPATTPPRAAPSSPERRSSGPVRPNDGASARPPATTPSSWQAPPADDTTGRTQLRDDLATPPAAPRTSTPPRTGWSSGTSPNPDGLSASSGPGTPSSSGAGAGAGRASAATDDFPLEQTLHRPATPAPGDAAATTTAPRRRALPYVIAAAGIVVLAGIGGLVFALNAGSQSPAQESVEESSAPVDEIGVGAVVAAPTELAGTVTDDGTSVTFSWVNPDPQNGDEFLWNTYTSTETGQAERTDSPTVTLPVSAGGSVCIEVSVVRSDGKSSDATRTCAP